MRCKTDSRGLFWFCLGLFVEVFYVWVFLLLILCPPILTKELEKSVQLISEEEEIVCHTEVQLCIDY